MEYDQGKSKIESMESCFKSIPIKYGSIYRDSFLNATKNETSINFTAIENLALSSYPPALHLLGEFYLYGIHPYEVDFKKAKKYFKESAGEGFAASFSKLGFMYSYGIGTSRDSAKASIYHTLGCQRGSAHSCLNRAFSYAFGFGAPRSPKHSGSILLPISSFIIGRRLGGDLTSNSVTKLTNKLELEAQVKESDESVLSLLEYKIALGDKDAELDMGKVHYYGKLGQEVNKEAARRIFEKHQDDPIALVHLGRIHQLGEGVPVDLELAKDYYRRAVDMNEPNAMNILGVLEDTEGNPEGRELIQRAADAGHDGAAFNIAIGEINNPSMRGKVYKSLKSLAKKGILEANHYVAEMLILGAPKFDDTKALAYLFYNIQFGPWVDKSEAAEELFKNGNYKAASLIWMELGDCGLPVAAYNAGLMMYKWHALSKEAFLEESVRLKIASTMFRITNAMTELDMSNSLFDIYTKMNKTEKAKDMLLSNAKSSAGYFHIASRMLDGSLRLDLESLFGNLSISVQKDKKAILPVIVISPKIFQSVVTQIIKWKQSKLTDIEEQYLKSFFVSFFKSHFNGIFAFIDLIVLVFLIRRRVSKLYYM